MIKYFKSKILKSFVYVIEHSDHIINFAKFFQPPPQSTFITTMSTLIILNFNLIAKSNQKPNE